MKRSRSSPGNTHFDLEVNVLNHHKTLPNGNTSRPNERRRSRDEIPKVTNVVSAKSWLNLSHKLSNLSISSSWAAGHQFLSKSLTSCPSYDHIELLQRLPEDIANQLTLLDLPVFQAISKDELLSVGWNSREKSLIAPNVVALTRRFNQVSFWVVEEILLSSRGGSSEQQAKTRAEVISYFIKVAKKLAELNNLHSCYAIVSALTSSPLFRLSRTWPHVKTKDRNFLARLTSLFSDEENFSALRKHINHIEPPGIPYLGMYLRDLVYIKLAHADGNTRLTQMNNVLDAIIKFQKSSYAIEPQPTIQAYLSAAKYIEELEKFLEEDNFKLSLRLEPPSTLDRAPSNKEEERPFHPGTPGKGSDRSIRDRSNDSKSQVTAGSSRFYLDSTDFVPSHRKSRSLGTGALLDTSCAPLVRHLIDDSVIDPLPEIGELVVDQSVTLQTASPCNVNVNGTSASTSSCLTPSPTVSSPALLEGYVKRKTLFKDGMKPAFSAWIRYWIQVTSRGMIYYPARSLKGGSRDKFSHTPCKTVSLTQGWTAKPVGISDPDCFTLIDPSGKNVYLFNTATGANRWCQLLAALALQDRLIQQVKCHAY